LPRPPISQLDPSVLATANARSLGSEPSIKKQNLKQTKAEEQGGDSSDNKDSAGNPETESKPVKPKSALGKKQKKKEVLLKRSFTLAATDIQTINGKALSMSAEKQKIVNASSSLREILRIYREQNQ